MNPPIRGKRGPARSEQTLAIEAMLQSGARQSHIAAVHGITRARVHTIAQKLKKRIDSNPLPVENTDQ
jgi:hypothetical protein